MENSKENPPLRANVAKDEAKKDAGQNVSNVSRITHDFEYGNTFDIHRLENLKGSGGQYTARCPAHDDRHASLSVKIEHDKVLLHCHTGCTTEAIVAALGIPMSALFLNTQKTYERTPRKKPQRINTIEYEYKNPNGSIAYKKKRFELDDGSKSFAFYDANGKKGVSGIQRVPFNLPAVIAADTVYFCEGEKAAHAVIKTGRVATSLDAGAKSKWLPEYTAYFEGKSVIILPDNDKPGISYAKNIAAQLPGSKIIKLPGLPEKGDVYDWLEAGHSIEEIDNLPCENLKAEEYEEDTLDYSDRRYDLRNVDYDHDYVIVTYTEDKIKMSCRKSDYLEMGSPGDYKSERVEPIMENLKLLLKHYSIEIKYNVLKNRADVYQRGEIKNRLEEKINYLMDRCTVQRYKTTQTTLEGQFMAISKMNKYNPIAEYLSKCYKDYDSGDYVGELCDTIQSPLGAMKKRTYIFRFLLQMVWVACGDEKDMRHHSEFCLTLQGRQGQGKTSWFRNLLPEHLQSEYFLDGRSMDLSKKDDILEQATVWLCEMGEIAATFKKSDQEDLKKYITAALDKVRPPYGKEAIEKKRRMCLCATTNDREFLRDATGDRRFAVIPCESINQFHDVNITKLWAQIYHEFLSGNDFYYFTEAEIKELFADNRLFRVKSDIELSIAEIFDLFLPDEEDSWAEQGKWFKASAILQKLRSAGLDTKFITLKSITSTLKDTGCKWRTYGNSTEFYLALL